MMQRDTFLVGLLAAVIFPAAFWFGLHYLDQNASGSEIFGLTFGGFRESFIATLAVCSNFFPFFVYMRARKDHAMRAVGVVTIILAIALVGHYYLFLF